MILEKTMPSNSYMRDPEMALLKVLGTIGLEVLGLYLILASLLAFF